MARRLMICLFLGACGGGGIGGDDGGDDQPGTLDVRLPQALEGAMLANPDVYTTIPVRVEVDGAPETVTVSVDGEAVVAEADGDAWVAVIGLGGLAEGAHTLEASADGGRATAELVISRTGTQVTQIGVDGNAGTPRLLASDGRIDLTWTDSRDGKRKARIAQLDGAGRFVAEPTVLLERDADVLYARTARGDDGTIGVLFQEPGGPYANFFAVVQPDGTEVVAPIPLDPEDAYGSYGGDVAWDGSAYVLIWRANDGAGTSHVRWMRVTPAGGVTGPIVVAAAGNDDPHGGFDPITEIAIDAAGGESVIAFVRGYWDTALELSLPRCQVATVARDGAVGEPQYARPGWYWHHDCRLLDGGLLVWGEQDLNDPSDTPPTAFRGTQLADGVVASASAVMVTAPEHRGDPVSSDGVMAWTDERSYVDLQTGRIELFVAGVSDDLATETAVVFRHARFIAGTSQLGLTPIGSNRLITWIDERHGNGITDPAPEVWIDLAWY